MFDVIAAGNWGGMMGKRYGRVRVSSSRSNSLDEAADFVDNRNSSNLKLSVVVWTPVVVSSKHVRYIGPTTRFRETSNLPLQMTHR